ncbi:MAG: flagellar biosynthesis protein FlhB [Phycisphaeraceae bacterium]|nr:flagellar biosynthesis protein FlhB [Phycisphaeraceae bacterium]
MAQELGEKTEAPTGRRLGDARNKGQVPKSTELTGAIEIAVALVVLLLLGAWMIGGMSSVMRRTLELESDASALGYSDLARTIKWAAIEGVTIAGPFMIIMFVAAAIAHMMQVGVLFTTYPLKPKLEKLNPVAGVKRVLGLRGMVKGAMGVTKLVIAAGIATIVLASNMGALATLPNLDVLAAVSVMTSSIVELAAWVIAIFLVLGVLDWWYQKWQHTRDLRMTKQEVKDERRSMEGDPEIKRRRMKIAYEMAMQRIRSDVPKADVIVTNPTHFAVALRYDSEKMRAPVVVAKGADLLAYRIREVAAVYGVPIVERPPLARALYYNVEVGHAIDPEQYEAVAEVLAYVYRLDRRTA